VVFFEGEAVVVFVIAVGAEVGETLWGGEGHVDDVQLEVAQVERAAQHRDVGRTNVFEKHLIKIDATEEGMLFYFLGGDEALGGVLLEELLDEVSGVLAEALLELGLGVLDGVEQLRLVREVERRLPRQHLIQQTPETPPIARKAVPIPLEHFRGEVLGGAADAGGAGVGQHVVLGKTEIGELGKAILTYQHVLRLQIPIHHALPLQTLQSQQN